MASKKGGSKKMSSKKVGAKVSKTKSAVINRPVRHIRRAT
jgi:hypothetical protein